MMVGFLVGQGMSHKPEAVVSKHDSLLSLQNTIQDNTQYLQQLQDNDMGTVLKKVEEQLQENYYHLIQLEKNMEQLHVDMNHDLKVSDTVEKIYSVVSEKADVFKGNPEEMEVDSHLLQRVSNRLDTLSRHFNHLNQSVTTVLRRQDTVDDKMSKILKKMDDFLANK